MTSLIISQLQDQMHRSLYPLLENSENGRIVLLDAPDHSNVGDQAILLGELEYLKRSLPAAKVYVASWRTYRQSIDAFIQNADVILLHGGGNFGDIWENHHNFRLSIMKKFSTKRIIQLPQSIHFSSADKLNKTKLVIDECTDFHFLVRDKHSFDLAQREFACKSYLCPDMAFAMGPLIPAASVTDYFCLLRTDKEVGKVGAEAIIKALSHSNENYAFDDWLEDSPVARRVHTLLRWLAKSAIGAKIALRISKSFFQHYAEVRLRRGVSLLESGKKVVTNRLHGFIIATLLGRPRIVFDSYDGKIGHFMQTWMTSDKDAFLCEGLDDLVRRLDPPQVRAIG